MMINKNIITGLSLAVVLALSTGCANKDTNSLLSEKDKKIASLQAELASKDSLLKNNSNQLQSLKEKRSETNDENSVSNSLVPPNAKAGECYAKVLVPEKFEIKTKTKLVHGEKKDIKITPATYKVVDKKILMRKESTKLEVVPAVYKTVTEEILVKPEEVKLKTIPATYKTITEEILVQDEKKELISIPATYKTITEEVLVSPAHTQWKKGRGELEKVNNSTGDIMCLIEVPAVYKTITSKVVDKEAYTEEKITPAVYKTITTRVVDVPAHTEEVVIPAVYKTVEKEVLVTPETTKEVIIPAICKLVPTKVLDTPASQEVITTPAVYEDYEVKVKTDDSYLRWQKILCETNTKKDVIIDLQKALRAKGYYIQDVNGKYDTNTKNAVNKYQKDNGLSSGALTLKTLESLGL